MVLAKNRPKLTQTIFCQYYFITSYEKKITLCKEMPVISVDRVVGKKRIIRKNGGLRRWRGTRCRSPPPPAHTHKKESQNLGEF
jgi:hypothetical protein